MGPNTPAVSMISQKLRKEFPTYLSFHDITEVKQSVYVPHYSFHDIMEVKQGNQHTWYLSFHDITDVKQGVYQTSFHDNTLD